MGVLTEAMTRLRGEIGALRHERAASAIKRAASTNMRRTRVTALRSAFARDLSGAHRAWFGPTLSERRAEAKQQQRLAEEVEAQAKRKHEQQRLAEQVEAQAKRKHEQQRLSEEAEAKAKRGQQLAAAARSQAHTSVKPIPTQAQRPPLKGSKKH